MISRYTDGTKTDPALTLELEAISTHTSAPHQTFSRDQGWWIPHGSCWPWDRGWVDSARQLLPLGSGMGGFRRAAAGTAGTQPWLSAFWRNPPQLVTRGTISRSASLVHRVRQPWASRPRKTLEGKTPMLHSGATTKDSRGGDTHASQRGDHEKLSRGRHSCFTAWRMSHPIARAARRALPGRAAPLGWR